MKKNIKYIATALILVLAASCNKVDSNFTGEGHIRFAPQSVGTKATVDVKADLQAQTFAVVGLLNGASNFQNTIAYSGGTWDYGTTPANYLWKSGTHRFYAYTNEAGTLSANKLSVSKTLTTSEDAMNDLLYSTVFESTAEAWMASHTALDSPVPLYFHHLLSAVSIVVKNCTENAVTVKSVSAPAIPNKGTAEVDFTTLDTDMVPAVTYGDVTADGDFVTATPISEASIALSENEMVDVLKMAKVAATDTAGSYHVVWPQTLGEGDDAVKVTISYDMTSGEETKSYTTTVSLPADTWEANNKYEYVLQILPTDVRLVFIVQDWESVQKSIDTSDGSINMSNVMWQNFKVKLTQDATTLTNTLVNDDYSVYMFKDAYKKHVDENDQETWVKQEGYFPAQGYFTINYPESGSYRIGLIPAYRETSVDTTKYEIWVWMPKLEEDNEPVVVDGKVVYDWKKHDSTKGETITHDTIYFQVRASSSVPESHSGYKAQVDIWLKSSEENAEWVSAYSEVRANYACVIPATN